ncbi:hypothetical protein E4T46_05275 [Aureobasidium subglaciale]|nr:hypothetical protein E4T46_05275 [Aureobasidium subglaciale]
MYGKKFRSKATIDRQLGSLDEILLSKKLPTWLQNLVVERTTSDGTRYSRIPSPCSPSSLYAAHAAQSTIWLETTLTFGGAQRELEMSRSLSINWEARVSTLEALYRPGTHNQCIAEARNLLQEPFLPRLCGIECHMMLARCSVSMWQKTHHKQTAERLWSEYDVYWSSLEPTTEMLDVRQQLDELVHGASGPQLLRSTRLSARMRPRSSIPASTSSKRVKMEPLDSRVINNQGLDNCWTHVPNISLDGTGDKIYPGRTSGFGDHGYTASHHLRNHTEDNDVKHDPADLDAEYERQWIESDFKSYEQSKDQAPGITLPQFSQVLHQSPELPSLDTLLVPSYLTSPYSPFKRGPIPSCVISPPREPSPLPEMPQTPRLESLTSPSGSPPPSLFPEQPQSGPFVENHRTRYTRTSMRDVENTLRSGPITDGMMTSAADDVFGRTTQAKNPEIDAEVVMHNRNIASYVANPASGVIANYAVVLRVEEHGKITGYPCSDCAFRTVGGELVGWWDRMGNITDISGEPIRQYLYPSDTPH